MHTQCAANIKVASQENQGGICILHSYSAEESMQVGQN